MLRNSVDVWTKKAPLGAFFVAVAYAFPAWSLCDLPLATEGVERVQVASVHDGDTLTLADGRIIRLVGVNTPELEKAGRQDEPLAKEARDYLKAMLSTNSAQLLVGKQRKDRYQRVLGHLFSAEGDSVTAALLQAGYGFKVTIPPNLGFSDCYHGAELSAKQAQRGVWDHPYFAPKRALDKTLEGGYARIWGQVERVTLYRKTIWVDLHGAVSIKLERDYAQYLDGALLDELVRRSHDGAAMPELWLESRGWMSDRLQWSGKMPELVKQGKRKRFQMKVFHRQDLRIIDISRK